MIRVIMKGRILGYALQITGFCRFLFSRTVSTSSYGKFVTDLGALGCCSISTLPELTQTSNACTRGGRVLGYSCLGGLIYSWQKKKKKKAVEKLQQVHNSWDLTTLATHCSARFCCLFAMTVSYALFNFV